MNYIETEKLKRMHQDENTLTIIVPTYQRPRLLKRALLSLINQKYPNVKIMVFDNHSGDETKQVVADLMSKDSRIIYHCHERNIGAVANFSYGIKQVNTPFFAFLSDDDLVMPDCYNDAIAEMSKDKELKLVASKVIIIDGQYNLLGKSLDHYKSGKFDALRTMSNIPVERMPSWTGMVFRSDILDSIGAPDTEIYISDVEYVTRVCYHFPYLVTDKVGAIFTQLSGKANRKRYLLSSPDGRKKMYDLFESEYGNNESIGRMWAKNRLKYYKSLYKNGMRWLYEGDESSAIEAASIIIDHQNQRQGKFLFWLSKTTTGYLFFNAIIRPYFKLKNLTSKKKTVKKRARIPNEEELNCINYFKSLEKGR